VTPAVTGLVEDSGMLTEVAMLQMNGCQRADHLMDSCAWGSAALLAKVRDILNAESPPVM
jgi:hypothetical protein